MSRLLQALAWVAPEAAMKRARAVAALQEYRDYDGARRDRRTAAWIAKGSSANGEVGPALQRLRQRSRDLARNTAIGSRLLDVLVAHAIGCGVQVVFKTGRDSSEKRLAEMFAAWSEHSDVEDELDFAGQQMLAFRSMLEGGDSIIRLIDRPHDGRDFPPLRLQVLEGDHLDESRDGTIDGIDSRLGVGLDEWGARRGYWLHRRHPGETSLMSSAVEITQSRFISREDVIHLYRPLRAGQVRGVPIMTPILLDARDYADMREAMLIRLRTEACFSAFVRGGDTDPKLGKPKPGPNGRIEEIRPGTINYLMPGEEVTFATPAGSGAFEPVSLSTLMGMAAGGMITYDQLTGDLRQANYSSLRAGKIEFRRLVEQLQYLVFVPMVMRRVTRRFLDRSVLLGALNERKRDRVAVDYIMPANEPIDPKKDLEADILAVRSGRMSPQEFIAGWGRDWRDVLDDFEGFLTEIDKRDLVFDIDPRRVNQAGATQKDQADDEPPASKPKG